MSVFLAEYGAMIIHSDALFYRYPDSSTSMVNTEINGDANLRAQNLTILMQSIRHFFEVRIATPCTVNVANSDPQSGSRKLLLF